MTQRNPMTHIFATILLLQGVILCTSVKAQQQFFRVKPRNAEVGQGQVAIIPCEVANRRGRVQWTKDGLTLGYDRNLPGFARYSVLGSDDTGEYSLKIANVSMIDDAVFECQVGPSLNNRPIRASAKLTVMLPPSKIEISGIHPGSRLTIRENEMVELRCVVHDAKPKATIVWFRKNSEYLTETREDVDEVGSGGRTTTTSVIRFRPTSEDDGATWACEAEHPALINPPLRTAVLLSVQHPPGPPEITGYIEGETIRLGQTVTLICTAEGGNPLAVITWYRNGIKVDDSFTSSGRASSNTYSFMASTEDNNARYRCESTNQLSPTPLKAEIILSVQFSPAHVLLKGASEARAGEELAYECVTANSNPPALIQWFVDNYTIPQIQQHTHTVTSPQGGWVTHSNISVSVGPNDRNKIITCNAINSELNDVKTQSHVLTVIYPPSKPEIQGLDDGDVLVAGNLKRLTCISMSGNPLAKLKWFIGKREVVSVYNTVDNYATAELALVPDQRDNGAEIRCEASNAALDDGPLTARKRLSVEFAPKFVSVSVRPEQPKAGQNVTLSCESASARPPASISWWYLGQKLEGATEMITEGGDNGGFVTTSHLQVSLTPTHHGATVACEASNHITNQRAHQDLHLTVSHKPLFDDERTKIIDLVEGEAASINMTALANPSRIEYVWSKDRPHQVIPSSAEEEESTAGDREMKSLNEARTHNNNNHLRRRRVYADNGVLNVSVVRRGDAGTYTIRASNQEGATETRIEINVLYPPSITDITESLMVGQGESANLECAVDANPSTEATLRWERPGYDMTTKTKTTPGSFDPAKPNKRSVMLTVLNATAADSGKFWCVANNGVGDTVIKNATFLLVRHKPMMRKSPLLSKAASDLGEEAKVICESKAVPNVTFVWKRPSSGSTIDDNDTKYSVSPVEVLDELRYRSVLTVRNVTRKDYGSYECVARNSEGVAKTRIVLDVKSRPDPPTDLHVVNVTSDSVHLAWNPGFHGGMDQWFRVRYVRSGRFEDPSTQDVYPANVQDVVLTGLEPGVQYSITLMAFNNIGESNYTSGPPVIVRTSDGPLKNEMMREALEGKGEIPLIVIVSVAICGTVLLLLNIILISCFIHKRRRQNNAAKSQPDNDDESKQKQTPPSEGSSSHTGSTKSGTMELYTTSSYNETISAASGTGGETMSSISEKSCLSSHQNHQQHPLNNDYPTPVAYLQEDNFPYSRSTYLIDPPEVPVHNGNGGNRVTFESSQVPPPSAYHHHTGHAHQQLPQLSQQQQQLQDQDETGSTCMPPPMPQLSQLSDHHDPMSLYSVIHKERKQQQMAPLASREETETPSCVGDKNYEDTESEYAVQLRRQTHRHLMGENGGYAVTTANGVQGRPVAVVSQGPMVMQQQQLSNAAAAAAVYATLPGKQHYQQQPLRLPHPAELDLNLAGMQQTTHFNQVSPPNGNATRTGNGNSCSNPLTIQTDNHVVISPTRDEPPPASAVEGPICASSPKRSVSAFTTFGQSSTSSGSAASGSGNHPHHQRSNASTPMSPPPSIMPHPLSGMGVASSTGSTATASSNSATPSPQVMSSGSGHSGPIYQPLKRPTLNGLSGGVPTTGHLV